ncbi:MAG: restriction endonuclease subunit S [Flavobacteriales bacterium]|nr:restriction endonuclease subunit S [Flavobacteriales bacterium]
MSTTTAPAPGKKPLPNESRPGYKHTKLGWMPKEWEVTCLGSICKIHSGGTPNKANDFYWGGAYRGTLPVTRRQTF